MPWHWDDGTNGLLAPLSGMALRAILSSCGLIYQRVNHFPIRPSGFLDSGRGACAKGPGKIPRPKPQGGHTFLDHEVFVATGWPRYR